jgi:hypothetical protein
LLLDLSGYFQPSTASTTHETIQSPIVKPRQSSQLTLSSLSIHQTNVLLNFQLRITSVRYAQAKQRRT